MSALAWPRVALPLVVGLILGSCDGPGPQRPAARPPAAGAEAAAEAEPQPPAPTAPARELHHVTMDDGHALAVHGKRPADARLTVVLVHGRTWSAVPDFDLQVPGRGGERSLMDALARAQISSYAVDLRGYGASARDATGWLTPDRAARDLLAVLDWVRQRDGRVPYLLGWSYGSMVSQLAVQRAPAAVAGLVLYGYPRDPDDPARGAGPTPKAPPRRANTAKAAAEDFITPGSIPKDVVQAYVDAALAADPVRADWAHIEQWAELDPAKVCVPVLVLHGEHDPYARLPALARLFVRLGHPDRTWTIIPDSDHAAHLEDAGPRVLAALLAFFDRQDPAPAASP